MPYLPETEALPSRAPVLQCGGVARLPHAVHYESMASLSQNLSYNQGGRHLDNRRLENAITGVPSLSIPTSTMLFAMSQSRMMRFEAANRPDIVNSALRAGGMQQQQQQQELVDVYGAARVDDDDGECDHDHALAGSVEEFVRRRGAAAAAATIKI